MRRLATFVAILGCALTGVTTCGAASPAVRAGQRAVVDRASVARRDGAATAALGNRRVKVVTFAGYTLEVPVSWPVYQLALDRSRCVRYDRHAVYLGRPGADQQCPAHLVGRVATLTLQPPGQSAVLPSYGSWRSVDPGWLGQGSGDPGYPAPGAALIRRDPWDQQIWAAFGGGLTATATYSGGTGLIRAILGTVRWSGPVAAAAAGVLDRAGSRPADGSRRAVPGARPAPSLPGTPSPSDTPSAPGTPSPSSGPSASGSASPSSGPSTSSPPSPSSGPSASGSPTASSSPSASNSPSSSSSPGSVRAAKHGHRRCHKRCCRHHRRCPRFWRFRLPVKGFDTCATPSLHAMSAWHRAFTAAAIYLGGPEAACGWGNLSAAWVRDVVHMGWALLPAYVGPQAPCTGFGVRIHPGSAEAQGRGAARAAIRLARALRFGRHTPIYYDMEAYDDRLGVCRHAVLAFLDGWTRELRSRGYTSGVYSSAGAAAHDLGSTGTIYGHRLAKPNTLWFALWDKRQNIQGWPYLLRHWWTGRHRVKQWMGAHRLRINGVRMSVDSDQVCGAIYRPRRRFEGCRGLPRGTGAIRQKRPDLTTTPGCGVWDVSDGTGRDEG